jgi:hypothetical protein
VQKVRMRSICNSIIKLIAMNPLRHFPRLTIGVGIAGSYLEVGTPQKVAWVCLSHLCPQPLLTYNKTMYRVMVEKREGTDTKIP